MGWVKVVAAIKEAAADSIKAAEIAASNRTVEAGRTVLPNNSKGTNSHSNNRTSQ